MTKKTKILGTGSYLPEDRVTNTQLQERGINTNDEWIVQRTGIEARRYADDNETTSMMAVEAAHNALEVAGLDPEDLGGIIVATTTPDLVFPSTAALVQANLGVKTHCMAFDVQAVCSGFLYALATANSYLKGGMCDKPILVIGAEKMSSILDWNDRTTCVLFGDGAGAVVLGLASGNEGTDIVDTHLHADGSYADMLCTTGGTSTTNDQALLTMQGREVFKFAVEAMSSVVMNILAENNMTEKDIDWLVPHQANKRIIEATAKKLNMPMDRVVLTLPEHGNTSAASIPLALDSAMRDGSIQPGQTILLEAMGGGFTWGAMIIKV